MDDQYAPYGSSNEGELAGRPRAALEKYEAAQLAKLSGNIRAERVAYPWRRFWSWLASLFRRKARPPRASAPGHLAIDAWAAEQRKRKARR